MGSCTDIAIDCTMAKGWKQEPGLETGGWGSAARLGDWRPLSKGEPFEIGAARGGKWKNLTFH